MSDSMTWKSIDSVPKDGRAVLLCWAFDADGKPIDWEADPSTAGVFIQVASWWEHDGWVVYCSQVKDPSLHFNPTHWMEVPPPPSKTSPRHE